MSARRAVRMIVAALWGLSIVFYAAAKIHFFTRYGSLNVGRYIGEHSVYWLGMAVIGLLIWAMTKLLPEDRQ